VDRALSADVTRRTRIRRLTSVIVPVAVVAAALVWLPGWLRPSVNLSRIRTAPVVAGPIDASITASGLVVPALERVVSSPLDARVLRILQRPGAALRRGDPVLELDVSESAAAVARAENDLAVKDNEQQQTRLGYEKSLVDLDGRLRIKALELESRRATLDMHRSLAAKGLLSKEELRTSELAVQQAEIQLAQLTDERTNAGAATDIQLKGLALQRATAARDVAEKRRVLDLATTEADRDGVLTWIVSEEGALVRRGDVLARIADLTAFRVDATVSDVHTGRLRVGLPAVVRIDEISLEGQVSEVFPSVDNGTLRFTVALRESVHAGLRPNLRADVQVVTERKPRALKVKRGPFADGSGAHQLFVLDGSRAMRRTVELGVSNFDDIEVVSGLREGETVVISDMRDYTHLTEVRVR
jgi:HlyD family secretion protein